MATDCNVHVFTLLGPLPSYGSTWALTTDFGPNGRSIMLGQVRTSETYEYVWCSNSITQGSNIKNVYRSTQIWRGILISMVRTQMYGLNLRVHDKHIMNKFYLEYLNKLLNITNYYTTTTTTTINQLSKRITTTTTYNYPQLLLQPTQCFARIHKLI